jgi:tetratricopeptide (TPR) repeat protein
MKMEIRVLGLWMLAIGLASPVWAAGEGQEDLDKAMDAKLNATTLTDLTEVITLTESALKKGVEKDSVAFANKLLASALLQRARESAKHTISGATSVDDYRKKRDFAVADLERAAQLDPTLAETHLLLAQMYLLPGGDVKKARQSLDLALKCEWEDPSVHVKALVLHSGLEETLDKKLADLQEAVKLAPNDVAAVRARGLVLADLNKLQESLIDLNKAIQLDASDGPTYEAKAIVLAKQEKFDEALEVLDKAQKLNPDSVMPLVQRARVHSSQDKHDAAVADLNRALQLSPNNPAVLLLRASVYQEKGDKVKALEDVDQVLKLKPDMAAAIRTRAVLLADCQRLNDAVEELEKLRKMTPKDPLTLLQLAVLYNAQKKNKEAIDTYTEVLAVAPEDWRAIHGRGDSYLNMGRHAEAIADYEKALKAQPKDQSILNNLAWTLATSPDDKIRNGKKALEFAKQACEVSEYKAAYILSTLAAAYAELGDFESAVKWSTKAVELGGKEHKVALQKELESYKAKKPWREDLAKEAAEEKADEKEKTATPNTVAPASPPKTP